MRRTGADSKLVVAHKMTSDSDVIGPETFAERILTGAARRADFGVKSLVNGLTRRFTRSDYPLGPETSLSIFGSGMVRKVRTLRPDIVHLSWICAGLARPQSLKALGGLPLVWRLEDMWPFTGTEHYTSDSRFVEGYRRSNRSPETRGLDLDRWVWKKKRAVYSQLKDLTIVCQSSWMAQQARASELLGARRIEVIGPGVDLEMYSPSAREQARDELSIPRDDNVVLFGAVGGGSNPRKGFDLLLEALDRVRYLDKRPVRLVVLGSEGSSSRSPFPSMYLGHIADESKMVQAFSAADVYVSPARQENAGQTVIEAMACGTPTVAFEVGGFPDAIEHEVSGYLATPFDATDLARGIVSMLPDDASKRSELSEAARTRAERNFDVVKQARKCLDLFAELIALRKNLRVSPPTGPSKSSGLEGISSAR